MGLHSYGSDFARHQTENWLTLTGYLLRKEIGEGIKTIIFKYYNGKHPYLNEYFGRLTLRKNYYGLVQRFCFIAPSKWNTLPRNWKRTTLTLSNVT